MKKVEATMQVKYIRIKTKHDPDGEAAEILLTTKDLMLIRSIESNMAAQDIIEIKKVKGI